MRRRVCTVTLSQNLGRIDAVHGSRELENLVNEILSEGTWGKDQSAVRRKSLESSAAGERLENYGSEMKSPGSLDLSE